MRSWLKLPTVPPLELQWCHFSTHVADWLIIAPPVVLIEWQKCSFVSQCEAHLSTSWIRLISKSGARLSGFNEKLHGMDTKLSEDQRTGFLYTGSVHETEMYTAYVTDSSMALLQALWSPTIFSRSHQHWLWVESWCITGDQERKELSPLSWAGTQVKSYQHFYCFHKRV